jgi:hypothetical protein
VLVGVSLVRAFCMSLSPPRRHRRHVGAEVYQ